MRENSDPELKRLREVAISLLGSDKGNMLANLVGEISSKVGGSATVGPIPSWAQNYEDKRHLLRWDNSQYVGFLGVNGKLILCIVDTGAHRTIIDSVMARELGLTVKTDNLQCGKFSVPGSAAVHSYAGIIEGSTTLKIGDRLAARVENMRVIKHPHPFVLLGADVLSGGRNSSSWNFTGMRVQTTDIGQVKAHLTFDVQGTEMAIDLAHAPSGQAKSEVGHVAFIGGAMPLSGGQCLRRNA